MYNGRFSGKSRRRHLKKRQFAVIVSIALLLVGMVGGSLAYLFTSTEDVNNTFTPAEVPPVIDEDFDKSTKKDVKIINDGTVAAYIRAAVIVNWLDDDGNIVANPEGHEYSCPVHTDNGWFDGGDGYYYYSSIVSVGGTTTELITEAKPTAGTVYRLQIDVMAQTIQTVPDSVVADKWPAVKVENGKLVKK